MFLSNGRFVYDFEPDGILDLSIGPVVNGPGAYGVYHPTRPTSEEQREYQETLSK